jgi:cell wall-associated NlpC family hydrolase
VYTAPEPCGRAVLDAWLQVSREPLGVFSCNTSPIRSSGHMHRARRVLSLALALVVSGGLAALPARAAPEATQFSDVPKDHWAHDAIQYATDPGRNWIPARTEGFGPDDPFTRRDLARAFARAFPPPPGYSSPRTFDDVAADDPMLEEFRWLAQKHWLPVKNRLIKPSAPVTRRIFDPAAVRALGFTEEANGIQRLQTATGERVISGWQTGFLLVAQRLELYPNLHPESAELRPGQTMTRAHAAMALKRTVGWVGVSEWSTNWRLEGYAQPPVLPKMSKLRLRAVRWALTYAGFPYIWGGEWHRPTRTGYPYGAQPQGGFDCSGYAWWVLQQSSDSWNVSKMRGYDGWSLGGRTATDMARKASKKIAYAKAMPMDLAFFELNGDPARFEHMGVMLGNGWMIHSSGGRGGVSLERIESGYWRDKFVHARRVIPADA